MQIYAAPHIMQLRKIHMRPFKGLYYFVKQNNVELILAYFCHPSERLLRS